MLYYYYYYYYYYYNGEWLGLSGKWLRERRRWLQSSPRRQPMSDLLILSPYLTVDSPNSSSSKLTIFYWFHHCIISIIIALYSRLVICVGKLWGLYYASILCRRFFMIFSPFFISRSYCTQYDGLLAWYGRLSVCLSVTLCIVYSLGRCRGLKLYRRVPSRALPIHSFRHLLTGIKSRL